MLKQKHKEEMMLRKQKNAEMEALHAKNQIVNFTDKIIEKDRLLKDLQQQINHNSLLINENLANYTLITDEEWEKFRFEFLKGYPVFLPALRQKIENITPSEERLSALLYLKLTTGQIASTLGISDESVSRSKRRLKLRLNLSQNHKLEDYLLSLA
jgi:DNA-binding CsgD family transcriptional regulator